jgi:putative copper resistance protein D
VALVTTAATLPLQGAVIGNGWPDALNPAVLLPLLVATGIGHAWQLQAIAALLLAATLLAPERRRIPATAIAAGLLLAELALTGHAAMNGRSLAAQHGANDAIHVLASGAWVGALLPLILVLGRLDHWLWQPEAMTALKRFSVAGHAAVALSIATGIVNARLTIGALPLDWSSPYQSLLAVKIVLVALMIALACLNRYRLAPQMAHNHSESLRAIRANAMGEVAIGICAIGLVAAFGMLDPR